MLIRLSPLTSAKEFQQLRISGYWSISFLFWLVLNIPLLLSRPASTRKENQHRTPPACYNSADVPGSPGSVCGGGVGGLRRPRPLLDAARAVGVSRLPQSPVDSAYL